MISLEGDFLESLLPNRPGCWVYRQVGDAVYETDLSQSEMQALNARWAEARAERFRVLNQHPLNQAAQAILARRPEYAGGHMALLDLVFASFFEEGREDGDEEMMLAAEWLTDEVRSQAFLRTIEEDGTVSPESLAGLSVLEAGQRIWE